MKPTKRATIIWREWSDPQSARYLAKAIANDAKSHAVMVRSADLNCTSLYRVTLTVEEVKAP